MVIAKCEMALILKGTITQCLGNVKLFFGQCVYYINNSDQFSLAMLCLLYHSLQFEQDLMHFSTGLEY